MTELLTHTHTHSGWRVNFPRMLSTWQSPRDLDQKVLNEQDAGEISPNPTRYPPTIWNEDLFDLNSLINLGIFSYKYKYTNITHLSGLITSVSCTWATMWAWPWKGGETLPGPWDSVTASQRALNGSDEQEPLACYHNNCKCVPWELHGEGCCCSVTKLCPTLVTPLTAARQASLPSTTFQSLPKLMSIKSMMLSNHLILCRPLLLLPSIFPSIRIFPSESAVCCFVLTKHWRREW